LVFHSSAITLMHGPINIRLVRNIADHFPVLLYAANCPSLRAFHK